jgi:membrane-bound transcription factor site-1 protease
MSGPCVGALLVVDTEEDFDKAEISKLYKDVYSHGLSLIVFADWYNTNVMTGAKFFDENTQQWWLPVTGGANVPALNNLLRPYAIQLSDSVYEGEYVLGEHRSYYASGTSIVRFPQSQFSYIIRQSMNDQALDFLKIKQVTVDNVAILGLHQIEFNESSHMNFLPGRIAVYGDSNCLDSSHMESGTLLDKHCLYLTNLTRLLFDSMIRLFLAIISDTRVHMS